MSETLLEVRSLSLTVRTAGGIVPILRSVDLKINQGEIVGLVGESGSGKSMTARCIIRSLPSGSQVGGTVRLAGEDLLRLSPSRLRELRSKEIGVIFQDPRSGGGASRPWRPKSGRGSGPRDRSALTSRDP